MVKIDAVGISRKLRTGKTEKLIKEVFGDFPLITSSPSRMIGVKDRDFLEPFLIIGLEENRFVLMDKKYFDRTYELAEKYEREFGSEVILRIKYLTINPNI